MINYKEFKVKDINLIDDIYIQLLKNKWQFIILNKRYVLTKEKSLFKIEYMQEFIKRAREDTYYRTIIEDKKMANINDLKVYRRYIEKYKKLMSDIYGNKYIFGSVAVKTKDGFITTIRGKQSFNDYTIVTQVDHSNHIIKVSGKKATLNAPLLDNLFKNEVVKVIVHINHYFDKKLPYYKYFFPGTIRDSYRDNKTSFNIEHHGVIYMFDKFGNIL